MAINTLEELIEAVQKGVVEKGEYCDAIVDDVYALIYMAVQEEKKSESALKRTLIHLCENIDEINTNKNVSRQIATQVSLFLYDKLSKREGFFETEGEPLKYAHNSLKEDDEFFDVMKSLVNIFKDTRVFDKNSIGFSDLTYGQAILVQMFCYEMYKFDMIQKMLGIDSLLLRSELEIARRKILGIEIPESVFVKDTPVEDDDIFEEDEKAFAAAKKAVAIENRKVSIPAEVYPDPVEDTEDVGIEFEEGFDVDALQKEAELVSPAEEYENNVSQGMEDSFNEAEEVALNTVSFVPVANKKNNSRSIENVKKAQDKRDIESEFMNDDHTGSIDYKELESDDQIRKTFKPEINVDKDDSIDEEETPNGVIAMLFPGLGIIGRIVVDIVVLAVLVVIVYIIATFLK